MLLDLQDNVGIQVVFVKQFSGNAPHALLRNQDDEITVLDPIRVKIVGGQGRIRERSRFFTREYEQVRPEVSARKEYMVGKHIHIRA